MRHGFQSSADDLNQPQQRGNTCDAADRIIVRVGTGDDGTTLNRALGEVPAMLVAGTTGSGKSSFVKTLVAEVMEGRTPRDVSFEIGDSSRIEYGCFSTSPFLAMPVARDTNQVETLVRITASESERRMALLARHAETDYPHMFVILDDFVALGPSEDMLVSMERVLQTARLTKMHVVLVTSLPSSRLLTSGILSNIDCRVSFRVTSRADSLRAINQAGANTLKTPGEMIYCSGGYCERCMASYVDDAELQKMCDEAGMRYEYGAAFFAPSDLLHPQESRVVQRKDSIDESLINEAARIVVETQLGSTSGLQRRLKVGYAMAGRIMDELEARGVVGPASGSRPRDVLKSSL